EDVVAIVACAWSNGNQTRGNYARQVAYLLHEGIMEAHNFRGGVVVAVGKSIAEGKHTVRGAAQVRRAQMHEALEQKPSRDQQNQGGAPLQPLAVPSAARQETRLPPAIEPIPATPKAGAYPWMRSPEPDRPQALTQTRSQLQKSIPCCPSVYLRPAAGLASV